MTPMLADLLLVQRSLRRHVRSLMFSLYNDLGKLMRPEELLVRARGMAPHRIRRTGELLQVHGDGLVLGPHREGEVWIVRLGRAAARTFVHHEISAMGLDR